MEVKIPRDISENVERVSRKLGLNKEEVVRRALIFYLNNIIKGKNLKEELESWESAGIEDLENFENKI